MKVVLADDDRTTRTLLTRALERWNYEVIAVPNGEAAWAAVQADAVQMLVTDWEMPLLDGPGLCARVRASEVGRFAYILLLTSHNDPEKTAQALDAGADDFVSKPFNATELRARLAVGRRIVTMHDELQQKNRELEVANAVLARIAGTDGLLGIGNRRSFEDAITTTHHAARRGQQSYGVILSDVDHFKRCNDTHGHAFGDRVLAGVAAALRKALGDTGELFRYGGEEIVAIAPAPSAMALLALAEKLRTAVAETRIEATGTTASVTASFGVAHYDTAEEVTCQVIVDRADAALYRAKADGRDRVALWTGADPFHRASILSRPV